MTGHLAPEDDDAYGDLYHVTYDDGDEEDLDFMQVSILQSGNAHTTYSYDSGQLSGRQLLFRTAAQEVLIERCFPWLFV